MPPKKPTPKPEPKPKERSLLESVFDKTLSIATQKLQQQQRLPDLMRKASRASYLLHSIANGNQKSLEYADSAALELRNILEEMGIETDWDW